MTAIEVGTICVKITGREAGHKCVVVDVIDKNFVLVTGPKGITGVRRRRANMGHIEPTSERVEVERGAGDDAVAKALEAEGKTEQMKEIVSPSFST
ncbi:MAG: 50S ribosomal protein L14e [Candidatus Bathyarchaeota archaeon]|nr:MAG: 50S ribosomal protein L14e [Candidatus Bathyarchaeota archaeon]